MSVLSVMLGLDARRFRSGMASAGSYANQFGSSLRGSLLSALGPIAIAMEAINLIKESFQDAKNISDLSQKYQVNGEQLQRIAAVGKKVGLEMEDVAKVMKDMNKAIASASSNPKAAAELARLGISAQDLASGNLTATDAFFKISAAMDGAGNKAQLLNALIAALGGSGEKVAAMLQLTDAEIRKIANNAPVVSDAMTQMADELGSTFDEVWKILKVVGMWLMAFVGALLGAIGVIAGSILTIVLGLYQGILWAIKQLMALLAKVAGALGADGLAKSLDAGSQAIDRHMDSVTNGIDKVSTFAVKSGQMSGRALGAMFGAEGEKKKQNARRVIPGLGDDASGKGKSGKSIAVQAIQALGGGGIAAGPNLAALQIEIAQKQLAEQKTTNKILSGQTGTPPPPITSGGSPSGSSETRSPTPNYMKMYPGF